MLVFSVADFQQTLTSLFSELAWSMWSVWHPLESKPFGGLMAAYSGSSYMLLPLLCPHHFWLTSLLHIQQILLHFCTRFFPQACFTHWLWVLQDTQLMLDTFMRPKPTTGPRMGQILSEFCWMNRWMTLEPKASVALWEDGQGGWPHHISHSVLSALQAFCWKDGFSFHDVKGK